MEIYQMETIRNALSVGLIAACVLTAMYVSTLAYSWWRYVRTLCDRALHGTGSDQIDALRILHVLPEGRNVLRRITADTAASVTVRASSGAMLAERAIEEDIDLLCEQLRNTASQRGCTTSKDRYMREMWVTGLSLVPERAQARAKAALTDLLVEEGDPQVKKTIRFHLARL
jgi:hypothetical protein